MALEPEDNISIQEVINICKTIKNENIEIPKDPIERPKTADFINEFGYLDDDIRSIIHSLEEDDYVEGLVEDNNPKFKHPFWVFRKFVDDIQIRLYIKIKIVNHKRKINVFSIHKEGVFE